ncbi:hypothetical protein BCU70_14180 [Vibrio sp. 10N.286.49.C2]|uniref:5-oxoprolinase subunit C family protein n=1 Tax=unclassified Vibrio TaxID=2614977 RepID=UPI000C847D0E|nr:MULTISPECIES: biotin-dependent carboxyltransferase family protein [unclassified Vibrio]PMH38935.1 hypothetical protein BCU70_14180 [Vibrio sp. 10N.286.49.C2]PMH55409.1 hypothetical protein BCU66_09945 [Vibrio sp. 10N.286.49.B1]PMH80866.1 hypothetical protein BCU58_03285 [Vibrio sp. 10N.286.48.B7]
MPALVIINPGHLCLVQDLGRFNVGQFGLSQGGACDLHAHCWGQKALGNPITNSSIEILFGHAQFQATDTITMILTGADCQAVTTPSLQPISSWQPFTLNKGECLTLKRPKSGLRTYLSIQGAFDIPSHLGSVSTVMRNQVGGINNGEPLKKGDILAIKQDTLPIAPTSDSPRPRSPMAGSQIPRSQISTYPALQKIKLIPSYQHTTFSDAFRRDFFQRTFTVSPQTDRMGIRLTIDQTSSPSSRATSPQLSQPRLTPQDISMISEGIVCGSVQITHGGSPIILLQDRQTLGGYRKIGVVAFRDLMKLGQLRPGDQLMFERTNLEVERVKQRAFFHAFSL